MPLAIVTKSKMHQGKDKSNAKKRRTNKQKHIALRQGSTVVVIGHQGLTKQLNYVRSKQKAKLLKRNHHKLEQQAEKTLYKLTFIYMILQTAWRLF